MWRDISRRWLSFRGAVCCSVVLCGCQLEQASLPVSAKQFEVTGPVPEPPQLTVTIDGKSVQPRLEFIGSNQEGAEYLLDVGIALALGTDRHLDFTWEGSDDELLFLTSPNQPRRLVGAKVLTSYRDGKKNLINPLASLDDAQIRGLWGLEVDGWSNAIAEAVAKLDFTRAWLTIQVGAAGGHSLPILPPGITLLRIESNSSDGLQDLSGLKGLPNMKALSIRLLSNSALDCSLFQSARQLKYLNISGQPLRNTAALGSLTALQVLQAPYCKGLKDVSFLNQLQALEILELSRTEVADLSPLSQSPRLRRVAANMTPVRKLPDTAVGLRELEIISSKVTNATVDTFRQSNPQCEVRHHWATTLLSLLKPTTRLRVRSGGTCHRNEALESTLFETQDVAEINQLLGGIQIVEDRSGFHCMCCGDPSLEFFEGDKLLLTLGFHHGQGLRWVDGWPGDAALSPESAAFIVDWLARRNVRGPTEERQAQREQELARERKLAQATTGMSESLAKAFRVGPEEFKTALEMEMPEKNDQVKVLLRIYGTSNDSWTSLDFVEQLADEALEEFGTMTLAPVVEKALLGDDRQLRRGAARLWRSGRSTLEDWAPANSDQLHRIVLTVERESRYYPLRMEALEDLAAWKDELSVEEIDRHLVAALHDPAPQVRRQAMLTAGRIKHQASIPQLVGVLKGDSVDIKPLPDVPAWEKDHVPDGFGDIAEGCSDAEVAALALAVMEHDAAKSDIEAIQPATAMTEVALALLGDGRLLKPEHFKTSNNNQELQLAAVQAVVRSKGQFGLELALGYQQATHWWEEEVVAERIGQMLVAENVPGKEQLVDCKNLGQLRDWFDKHGRDYLMRF
jgi:Leucine-rich repeat (LRR) protein